MDYHVRTVDICDIQVTKYFVHASGMVPMVWVHEILGLWSYKLTEFWDHEILVLEVFLVCKKFMIRDINQ